MLLGTGDQVLTAFYSSKMVKFYERNTAFNSTSSLISFSRVFIAVLEWTWLNLINVPRPESYVKGIKLVIVSSFPQSSPSKGFYLKWFPVSFKI